MIINCPYIENFAKIKNKKTYRIYASSCEFRCNCNDTVQCLFKFASQNEYIFPTGWYQYSGMEQPGKFSILKLKHTGVDPGRSIHCIFCRAILIEYEHLKLFNSIYNLSGLKGLILYLESIGFQKHQ